MREIDVSPGDAAPGPLGLHFVAPPAPAGACRRPRANLPIVLSELGDEGGVIGAARMISASVYAP